MIEYFPWSKKVLKDILSDYAHGYFTILDLELGGECNCNCIYCDSPDRKEKIFYSIEMIEEFMKGGRFKWLFVCGLGEPTFNENYDTLLKLLIFCKKNRIKCSIFTNATNISKELKHFISEDVLYILFKYDSFFDEVNKKIIGNNSIGSYNDVFSEMAQMVKVEDSCSNIAASIVPTVFNEDILIELVKRCTENNIYPLIGSLEDAGKAQINYGTLSITEEKLILIKNQIEQYFAEEYVLPICPSTVGAIHITNKGDIVVDSRTGLSCSWFWMETPCMVTLGNIMEHSTYDEICNEIIRYRKSVKNKIKYILNDDVNNIFGGCGGDVETLLSIVSRNQVI